MMNIKMIGLAAVVALVPAIALAQGSNIDSRNSNNAQTGVPWNTTTPQPNNSHYAAGTASRDGCENIPGEAHNSADCAKIDASDMNTAENRPTTDISGRPTGASENADRNARILSGQSSD
jgi:hypothetical protein